MSSLLPPNATELELKLENISAREIPSVVNTLADIDNIPVEFLKILAIGLSVDYWNDNWTESKKRAEIKDSILVHRIKGSKRSIYVALSNIPANIKILEWFEQIPKAKPRTFSVTLNITQDFLDKNILKEAIKRISLTKPLSTHFSLIVKQEINKNIKVAGIFVTTNFMKIKAKTQTFKAVKITFPNIVQSAEFKIIQMQEKK
ncbi:phage tail protein I [Francisella philomiragia]|uniref:phage tail protein I n=1 Tax=Francisella philomiragia TaxID=28110 RepID=UPI0022437E5E|nr:phage tail protein I [Francisella philomiragia]